jgi:membrane-bound lytic murein transglycosylase B
VKAAFAGALTISLALCAGIAFAQGEFEQCVVRLQNAAESAGVAPATATRVLATVSRLERVIEADRRQPEFVETFGNYFSRAVSADRILHGREMYARHRELLDRLGRRYGVPGPYLVAFWGMESNYGRFLGNIRVFDSLATLACDQRRSAYFTDEFVHALRVIDREGLDDGQMIGSWAGAMGQTQFMPSNYLAYAVDGDGDGRIDTWNSVPDALASAANFLNQLGWRSGERWGREVRLPADFDYYLAGRDRRLPVSEWRALGVTDTSGTPLPAVDMPASLLVPAGHGGPAFLVYQNFEVIMRWNRSEFFALSVGHLADRISGAGGLSQSPPALPRLSREQILAMQRRLAALGFSPGTPDGIFGPDTRSAVREYQQHLGRVADGQADAALLEALGLSID